MNIKITVRMVKEYLAKHPNEELEEVIRWQSPERDHSFEIDKLTDKQLADLKEIVSDNEEFGWAALKKINTFKNIQSNPGGRACKRLEDLAVAMKEFLKDAPNHWLFEERSDGQFVPYYIGPIKYHPADYRGGHTIPAYVTMNLFYFQRGGRKSNGKTWHKSDIVGGKTVGQLLIEEELYVPTDKMLKVYESSMERYKVLQEQTGEQFTAKGEGMLIAERWNRQQTSMVQEGVPDKLVMDDEHDEGEKYEDDNAATEDSFWDTGANASVTLPTHPYLKLFDLDRHGFVILHVDQLFDYKWDPSLGEKLILPRDHKEVIQILMDTASEEIDDIIKGKSGGTICICTGEPGTGKTLTAEVTSEVIKRPLYKVNCSQLGTDEEEIEEELQSVLNRATRWKALLLIDEADVYVRTRDNDIQQNAIVGVFLRVLEYYRGVLFLTSNRATVIDDAILSRATVHLKYARPDELQLLEIWKILSEQFGLPLSDKLLKELVTTFPRIVGRDVKNLLKLVVRYHRRQDDKNAKVTLDTFRRMAKHKDIEESE